MMPTNKVKKSNKIIKDTNCEDNFHTKVKRVLNKIFINFECL